MSRKPVSRVVRRPLLRWHGGKWRQAQKIIQLFGRHRVYVEPYGGAASVLLRKPPTYAEIYGDLDDEVVNLFRVLRDQKRAAELIRLLRLTPFSRTEFDEAYKRTRNRIERARRLIIRSFQGFGSDGATGTYRTGFRSNSNRARSTPAQDWAHYPDALLAIVERIQGIGVVVEHRDAMQLMLQHDSAETLHYVDPPYPLDTRSRTKRRPEAQGGGTYRHEMTNEEHAALLEFLRELEGMVVLSSYPNPLYDEMLGGWGWTRIEHEALADGAAPRLEVIWLNPAAAAACPIDLNPPDQLAMQWEAAE